MVSSVISDQSEPCELCVGAADEVLDKRLSDELDVFNVAAAPGPTAFELTVRCGEIGAAPDQL